MVVMVVGMVVSVVTNHDVTPVHPNLLASGIENLFCCLPRKFKEWVAMKEIFASHKYSATATAEADATNIAA